MTCPPAARGGLGLSPPTRGSPDRSVTSLWAGWSIPAHAGEPGRSILRLSVESVYPRPRGGAEDARIERVYEWGLSPPTRGSLLSNLLSRSLRGSIPAHAGEPSKIWPVGRAPLVYPRPRGGAVYHLAASPSPTGLSPPTRGSQHRPERRGVHRGSIPAHAGEPFPACCMSSTPGVYPRPRGGAPLEQVQVQVDWGLSPPTRGSRRLAPQSVQARGSIPAHAGEPDSR